MLRAVQLLNRELLRDRAHDNHWRIEDTGYEQAWTRREKVHAFLSFDREDHIFNSPVVLRWGLAYQVFTLVFIVLACVGFIIGSEPQYWNETPKWLYGIEWVVIVIFTLDYIVRFVTVRSERRWKWMKEVLNVVDLLSFLPFYIELVTGALLSGAGVLRLLRFTRVLRVVKLGKSSVMLKVVGAALQKSADGLALLALMLIMSLVFFGSAIFYAEQSQSTFNSTTQRWYYDKSVGGGESPFQSVLASFWWCITTITTVGYGDVVPITPVGRVVGGIVMISGLFVFAFPVTVFGSAFQNVYERHRRDEVDKKLDDQEVSFEHKMDAVMRALRRMEKNQALLTLSVHELRDAYREVMGRNAPVDSELAPFIEEDEIVSVPMPFTEEVGPEACDDTYDAKCSDDGDGDGSTRDTILPAILHVDDGVLDSAKVNPVVTSASSSLHALALASRLARRKMGNGGTIASVASNAAVDDVHTSDSSHSHTDSDGSDSGVELTEVKVARQ